MSAATACGLPPGRLVVGSVVDLSHCWVEFPELGIGTDPVARLLWHDAGRPVELKIERDHDSDPRELVEFARAHPCPRVPASMVPRFIGELASGSAGVFDLSVDGARVVLAVVVDTCANGDDAADLVLVGLREG
ncbi:hypothetical protein [Enhygromyxa salina]|uniref:hypothetical protein n=1 Tax=Enhygromyxa salina TaxID=215803 RepID=UPI0011B1E7B5|nr:hypothetical protein [Enhygromyxa salina]